MSQQHETAKKKALEAAISLIEKQFWGRVCDDTR